VLYKMLAFFGDYAKNETNSLFFLPVIRACYWWGTREGELQASTRTPLSTSAILSLKGVLDWLSNVDTTTAELRNHVRHSTWSLIELSEILPFCSNLRPMSRSFPSVGQLSPTLC